MLKKLGWDSLLTDAERAQIEKQGGNNADAVGWAVDLSGGIIRVTMEKGVMAYGNGKARAVAYNLPDPVPVHREPLYTARPDLVAKYSGAGRLPSLPYGQHRPHDPEDGRRKGRCQAIPDILTSGRLVEYEGGGEETRSNKWLAELQQDMFVEINPADAAERGIKEGAWVWVTGPEANSKARVKALVTDSRRQGRGLMPFHFAGWSRARPAPQLPEGHRSNRARRKGQHRYDLWLRPVTGMHEGKVTLCRSARLKGDHTWHV